MNLSHVIVPLTFLDAYIPVAKQHSATRLHPMLTKCDCQSCFEHLEFEAENAGETVTCPHCGADTLLSIPSTNIAPKRSRLPFKIGIRLPLIGAAIFTFALLAFLSLRWIMPLIRLYAPAFNTIIGGLIGLALLVIVAVWAMLWILFPVFVYFKLDTIISSINRIEAGTRPTNQVQPLQDNPETLPAAFRKVQ